VKTSVVDSDSFTSLNPHFKGIRIRDFEDQQLKKLEMLLTLKREYPTLQSGYGSGSTTVLKKHRYHRCLRKTKINLPDVVDSSCS
jgi:hypothetical protein